MTGREFYQKHKGKIVIGQGPNSDTTKEGVVCGYHLFERDFVAIAVTNDSGGWGEHSLPYSSGFISRSNISIDRPLPNRYWYVDLRNITIKSKPFKFGK